MELKIGDKVVLKKVLWVGSGTKEDPMRRADVIGEITSIRGMPGHTNKHKYEFTHERGRFYTNSEKFQKIK